MSLLGSTRGRVASALPGLLAAVLAGASPAPDHELGGQFSANVIGGQIAAGAQVAREPDGDFVVAWYRERDASFSGFDSWVRRFDASGTPLGDEIKVNTSAEQWEAVPRLAVSPRGDFVVVWYSRGAPDQSVYHGIQGQRFDALGQPIGPQFEISTSPTPVTPPTNFIDQASVAMAPDGRFVVVWRESMAVNARLYDAAGQALGEPFLVFAAGGDCWPVVDMDARGAFVVAWSHSGQEGQDIFARRYSATGDALGAAFRVNSNVDGDIDRQYPHRLPAVAVDGDGDFAVAWNRATSLWESPGSGDVYVRSYSNAGEPRTDALKVNGTDTGDLGPGLDLDAEGFGVVTWDLSSEERIAARRMEPDGTLGSELKVGSYVTDMSWGGGAVGMDADGDITYIWRSGMVRGQRTSGRRELDLAVTVEDSADQVPRDGDYSYRVRAVNNEAAVAPTGVPEVDMAIGTATGVAVDIDLPAGPVFQSFDAPGWACTRDGLAARCVLDDKLAAGASADIVLRFTAPAQDSYATLAASIDADQFDASNTANNGDSATTAIGDLTPEDETPDAFGFTDQAGVGRGATVTSDAFVVTGINVPTSIAVSGGSYSIGCSGTFTTAPGSVTAGETVCVRHVASAQFFTAVNTSLTIGGVADTFTSTTESADSTPFSFEFTDQEGVEPLAEVTSDVVIVTGTNVAADIGVSGGQYSINGGAFTDAAGSVEPGDSVRLRHVAALTYETPTQTTVVIGGVSDVFVSHTRAADATPDAFGFPDQVGVEPSTTVTSAGITVTGIEVSVPITVSAGSYSIGCVEPYTTAAGVIAPGQTVCVRHTAAAAFSTRSESVLTIGGASGRFATITREPPQEDANTSVGASGPGLLALLLGVAAVRRRRAGHSGHCCSGSGPGA